MSVLRSVADCSAMAELWAVPRSSQSQPCVNRSPRLKDGDRPDDDSLPAWSITLKLQRGEICTNIHVT